MNDLVPDRLDEPWTRSAMAKQSGVAPTTLKNWGARDQAPLATVPAPNGDAMYTWRHLLDFCAAHPYLHAIRQVREQYREHFADDPVNPPPQHSASAGATGETKHLTATTDTAPDDGVTLRSALQDLKTRIDKNSAVVAAALKLAEDAASVQATLVDHLNVLELALAAELRRES